MIEQEEGRLYAVFDGPGIAAAVVHVLGVLAQKFDVRSTGIVSGNEFGQDVSGRAARRANHERVLELGIALEVVEDELLAGIRRNRGDHLARYWQRCLIQRNRSQVRNGQFIFESVPIGIGTKPKASSDCIP